MTATFKKKLTVKAVVGDIGKLIRAGEIPAGQKGYPIMRIMGRITGVRHVESQFGPSVGFKGAFEATNILTGEQFSGSEAFLPDVLADQVAMQVQDTEGDVLFAVDIVIDIVDDPSESLIAPYEYSAKPLREMGAADPLAELRQDMPSLPALPKAARAGIEETSTDGAPNKKAPKKSSAKK